MKAHPNPARAIYGTILATAVIAGFSEDRHIATAEILAALGATTLVFWLAHVYAEWLGAGVAEGSRRRGLADLGPVMRQELPLAEGALLPGLGLLAGVVGILSRDHAVNVAIAIGVAELFGWGLRLGRLQHLPLLLAVGAGVLSALFGLAMVVLKVLVH
jgi:hypothetical protein